MAETTHTGLGHLAEMDLQDLAFWCGETHEFLERKAEAMRAQMAGHE